jgi:hypothetical protein
MFLIIIIVVVLIINSFPLILTILKVFFKVSIKHPIKISVKSVHDVSSVKVDSVDNVALGVETLEAKLSDSGDLLCPKCLVPCELTQQHSLTRYWIRSGVAVSLTDAEGSLKDRWIGDSH